MISSEKRTADGFLDRIKARLVVLGNLQTEADLVDENNAGCLCVLAPKNRGKKSEKTLLLSHLVGASSTYLDTYCCVYFKYAVVLCSTMYY